MPCLVHERRRGGVLLYGLAGIGQHGTGVNRGAPRGPSVARSAKGGAQDGREGRAAQGGQPAPVALIPVRLPKRVGDMDATMREDQTALLYGQVVSALPRVQFLHDL